MTVQLVNEFKVQNVEPMIDLFDEDLEQSFSDYQISQSYVTAMNTKDIALQESNNNIKSTPVKAQYISPKEERKKKDDSWETKFVMEPAFLDEKKAAFPSRAMKHAKTISLDIMESDIEEELKVSEDVDENYDEMRLQ